MDILSAFVERDVYRLWLEKTEKERNTAKLQGLTECQCCGFCCARRTCVPLPDELESIAANLQLSVDEMIGKYMVGDAQSTESGAWAQFLRWANTAQLDLTGTFLSTDRTYDKGDCVLYDPQKRECRIWAVRPVDAQQTTCWKPYQGDDSRDGWTDGQLQRVCPSMNLDPDEDWDDEEWDDDG